MSRASPTPTEMAAHIESAPATKRGLPQPELYGDIDMRITRNGSWLYHGSPIARKPLVKLFSTVLRREDDGNFYLVTPVERCLVHVDDAPFVAVELTRTTVNTQQVLTFRTNLDEVVTADLAHPIRVEHDAKTREPSPYILIRAGLDALIARPVYYELVGLGVEEIRDNNRVFGVWSSGHFFELGTLDEA